MHVCMYVYMYASIVIYVTYTYTIRHKYIPKLLYYKHISYIFFDIIYHKYFLGKLQRDVSRRILNGDDPL
jgi:hypothetical protein